MELGCSLIEYEKVSDDNGRRLIFFGRHAGIAGMFETLWALGRRLDWEGIANPFSSLRRVYDYSGVAELQAAARELGAAIRTQGLPEFSLGYVYLPALVGVVAISFLMAPVGARLAHRLPVKQLKRAFGGFLALLATKMLHGLLY